MYLTAKAMAKSNGNPALPGSRNAKPSGDPVGNMMAGRAGAPYSPGGRVPVSVWPGPGNYAKSKDGTPAMKGVVDPRPPMPGMPAMDRKTWDPMDDCPGD